MTDDLFTDRLQLSRAVPSDLDAVFAIQSDPRVWTHYPSLRHTTRDDSIRMMERWERSWERAGLGSWVVRMRDTGEVIGNGGCTLLDGDVWNVGYRIAADHHGRGYATELARAAVDRARILAPDRAVIAYLVEHNTGSARVAQKLGLELVHRAPDAGNPDPSAIRLVYADRALTPGQLEAALQ
ncbi:GNAT family N-acetyltransferase [Microbacterium sp. ISL-103]|uniref:GNAT family N-acetyltransferase n=1 Tax=Microbacterium sp. ISL-103 TaxID=2819156 RepID=UPI001BE939A7|nr:GNAT family N-acetyltransferase [Microbacterium sp. ISL-103]MBT2474078.1 GNAT family N-acetyltransferase [Microbacterium sp. ISL-103]